MTASVVVITGALAGIGRATALAFARRGDRVVISGRSDDAGAALLAEIQSLGGQSEFLRTDVRHDEDVRRLIDRTVERFGRLDVAVNNAGTEGKPAPLTEQSAESYAATFDTNVLGHYCPTRFIAISTGYRLETFLGPPRCQKTAELKGFSRKA
jgi:NAD(P)-dependent dehydrogenase (short-subunit alcohol dehydrogenase family)